MYVRCIANDVAKLDNELVKMRLADSIRREGQDEDLLLGATYKVVAIERWGDGGIRVYLHTVEENDYPYPYPIEMFDVIEPTIPMGWCVSLEQYDCGMYIKRIGFPEWANDGSFYERLVDGDEEAVAVYKNYQHRNVSGHPSPPNLTRS
ncbi:MAG: hypothetical protein II007_15840 [Gammaproteobacteria bacterium]|nr:hypothetical protein [Gammaproteobacteria bacterium]MBQ1785100.1 hypothetical protein [Gammaproteobacteria bacterium]